MPKRKNENSYSPVGVTYSYGSLLVEYFKYLIGISEWGMFVNKYHLKVKTVENFKISKISAPTKFGKNHGKYLVKPSCQLDKSKTEYWRSKTTTIRKKLFPGCVV